MNHTKQITEELKESIDGLYKEFSKYPRPPEGIVTCLDLGPTDEEVTAFARPLKEIPQDYIRRLEFYDQDVNEWGTVAEVKYLIPRILEYYVESIKSQDYWNLNYSTGLQFIRYKLTDLDVPNSSKWNENESDCIRRFLLLFHEYLSVLSEEEAIDAYLDFMDALCSVFENVEPILTIWEKVSEDLKSKQIEAWLKTHISVDTLELSPNNESLSLRAQENQNKIKTWVLSEDNITNNMDLFSQDPWWKLALK